MRLVIDTNIILAGLLRDGTTRRLITEGTHRLYAPSMGKEEIAKYEGLLREKTGLSEEKLSSLLSELFACIDWKGLEAYGGRIGEATRLIEDVGDAPFLALAISEGVDGIWSHDKGFLEQKRVRVYSTADLLHSDALRTKKTPR